MKELGQKIYALIELLLFAEIDIQLQFNNLMNVSLENYKTTTRNCAVLKQFLFFLYQQMELQTLFLNKEPDTLKIQIK